MSSPYASPTVLPFHVAVVQQRVPVDSIESRSVDGVTAPPSSGLSVILCVSYLTPASAPYINSLDAAASNLSTEAFTVRAFY